MEHWVQIYPNQKEINYISPHQPVLKPALLSYTIYSKSLPPSIPDILCPLHPTPPHPRFCDTSISSNDNDDDHDHDDDTSKSNLPAGWIQDIFR